MKNTAKYHDTIKYFRNELREINKRHSTEFAKLRGYEGTARYEDEKARLDAKRKAEVDALRSESLERANRVVDDMEKVYQSRPVTVPTADQLAILQALKMRDRISADEVRAAVDTMKGCPLAEQVLSELAHKHGHFIGIEQELSGASVKRHIDSLRRNADHLISRLEAPDSPGEHINVTQDYSLFYLDRDPADDADCIQRFGHMKDAAAFSALVD